MNKKKTVAFLLSTTLLANSAAYAASPFSKIWDKINDQNYWQQVRDDAEIQHWVTVSGWAEPVAVGGILFTWYGLFRPFTRKWLKNDAKIAQQSVKNMELLPKYLKIVYEIDARVIVWEKLGVVVVDPKYKKVAEVAQQLKTVIQDPKLAEKMARVVLGK